MTRSVVLLRGINVGGHNRLAMADLRTLLGDLGCRDVVTYVQSGNAVVDGPPDLVPAVERALAERGLDVRVLTRTAEELDAVVAGNPLEADPTMLHAVFLSGQPDPAVVDPAQLLPDQVVLGDRVVYVRYAGGSHGTAASKLLSGKRFPLVATARNWRTVLALQELVHRR